MRTVTKKWSEVKKGDRVVMTVQRVAKSNKRTDRAIKDLGYKDEFNELVYFSECETTDPDSTVEVVVEEGE